MESLLCEMLKVCSSLVHARLKTLVNILNSLANDFQGRSFQIFCIVLRSSLILYHFSDCSLASKQLLDSWHPRAIGCRCSSGQHDVHVLSDEAQQAKQLRRCLERRCRRTGLPSDKQAYNAACKAARDSIMKSRADHTHQVTAGGGFRRHSSDMENCQESATQSTTSCSWRHRVRRPRQQVQWLLHWQSKTYPWQHIDGPTQLQTVSECTDCSPPDCSCRPFSRWQSTRFGSCWPRCRARHRRSTSCHVPCSRSAQMSSHQSSPDSPTCRYRLERSRHVSSRPKCCSLPLLKKAGLNRSSPDYCFIIIAGHLSVREILSRLLS